MGQIPLAALPAAPGGIYNLAVRTPLIPLHLPPDIARRIPDSELYLKIETFQPIGCFKLRGAHNVVRQLQPDEVDQGVWTVSAGNAALGVALAARHRAA